MEPIIELFDTVFSFHNKFAMLYEIAFVNNVIFECLIGLCYYESKKLVKKEPPKQSPDNPRTFLYTVIELPTLAAVVAATAPPEEGFKEYEQNPWYTPLESAIIRNNVHAIFYLESFKESGETFDAEFMNSFFPFRFNFSTISTAKLKGPEPKYFDLAIKKEFKEYCKICILNDMHVPFWATRENTPFNKWLCEYYNIDQDFRTLIKSSQETLKAAPQETL